jgi:hypothetical protein
MLLCVFQGQNYRDFRPGSYCFLHREEPAQLLDDELQHKEIYIQKEAKASGIVEDTDVMLRL